MTNASQCAQKFPSFNTSTPTSWETPWSWINQDDWSPYLSPPSHSQNRSRPLPKKTHLALLPSYLLIPSDLISILFRNTFSVFFVGSFSSACPKFPPQFYLLVITTANFVVYVLPVFFLQLDIYYNYHHYKLEIILYKYLLPIIPT